MAIEFYDSLNIDSNDDSYFLGNVGIGTSTPSQKLHVAGNLRVTGAYYDSNNAPGTLDQVLTSTATGVAWVDPSTITAEAATLVVIECKNTSGATITKGTPVYQTGTVGATDVIEIAPADALISAGKQPAIGLLQTTLNNNGFGKVVITGEFLNFTTDPIDGLTPTTGQKVFLKSGGGLTLTKPTGPGNGIQNLGLIGKVSGGNSGSITVSSIMRTNDVPNLTTGKIWVGDGNTVESTVVYLDETNGRMGIGTTSPAEKLDVNGTVNLTNLKIATAQGTDGQVLTSTGSGVAWEDASGGSSPWVTDTNGITYTAGNVGIGTASQATLDLAVNGAARFNSDVRLDGSLLDVNGATGTSGQILSSEGAGGGVEWIDAPSGTVTSITATSGALGGLTGGTITTSGSIAIDYSGNNNFIFASGSEKTAVSTSDFIAVVDMSDAGRPVKYAEVGNLPVNGVDSTTTGEPTGSSTVTNIVQIDQIDYDAGTPVATTLYIIT